MRIRKLRAKAPAVHFHIRFKARTGCGKHWKDFWPEGGPENNWDRGSLPRGSSSGSFREVTCRDCLEHVAQVKRNEVKEIEDRLWDSE